VSSLHNNAEIGIVVDAGPQLGYGHAMRCVRLARALAKEHGVVLYPLSQRCKEFATSNLSGSTVRDVVSHRDTELFPPLVITDLREPHGITASIRRQGCRHVSIHDLGLAQCHSDVVIDGSITSLFPYTPERDRELFLGPQYMITRDPVRRSKATNTVLVTLGGGWSAQLAGNVSEQIVSLGLTPVMTRGFVGGSALSDAEFSEVMSNCSFAISASGVTVYDLLASGIPTVAVALDRLQLRTADAFHELGAVMSAGLIQRLSPSTLLRCLKEMLENRSLVQRMTATGRMLVDGKGLSRVVEIVRRQLWLTSQVKTFLVC
jgi:UDP-2,4-diacetamido-2,4,6-trideoxy-beta-L-altropyranose hydrolase